MEKPELMFECEACKKIFNASSSLTHKRNYEVDGLSIFLTYCDCPFCSKRHFVQIDNEVSLGKLREVTHLFTKLYAARKDNKRIPELQSAKFNKARQHLSDYRRKLMKKYTGKLIHDNDTDSDFVLRFSI